MTRSLVERQFGAHAKAYATSSVHAKGESLGRLVELVRPQPGWRVLDIATGAGHTACAFATHVASVVAADLTIEMLAEAARLAATKGLTNVETVRAAADHLPFADATFDLATCRIAAHHFPDPAAFVAEAARVLKPGGIFALDDNIAPDRDILAAFAPAEVEAAARAYNDFERHRDPSHVRALTTPEWLALIAAAGLEVTHSELMAKSMQFDPWASRLGASDATVAELRQQLGELSGPLQAFLRPESRDGKLVFTLTEAIIVANKPM